jgi:carbon storage regulator CsrA
MLIIKRKVGESIWIGEAKVVVSRRHGNIITLAIDAPQNVKVLRGEIDGAGGQERDQEIAPPRRSDETCTNS